MHSCRRQIIRRVFLINIPLCDDVPIIGTSYILICSLFRRWRSHPCEEMRFNEAEQQMALNHHRAINDRSPKAWSTTVLPDSMTTECTSNDAYSTGLIYTRVRICMYMRRIASWHLSPTCDLYKQKECHLADNVNNYLVDNNRCPTDANWCLRTYQYALQEH